jgi:hypothetical protein
LAIRKRADRTGGRNLEIALSVASTFTSSKEKDKEEDTGDKKELIAADFTTAAVIEERVKERHIIEIGNKARFAEGEKDEINFSTIAQPAFNRQFDCS